MTSTLRWGEATLRFDDEGDLVSLVHDQWGPYLAGWRIRTGRSEQSVPLVLADEDEVEVSRDLGPLTVTVRHSVGGGWDQRTVAAAGTDLPYAFGRPRLLLDPAPGCVGRVWAAGSRAIWAVAPAGEGPLLVAVQRQGCTADTDELALGPDAAWEAGERRIWRWQARWCADWRDAGALLPTWWPERTALREGLPLVVTAPDRAVDDDSGAWTVAEEEAGTEILPAGGRHRGSIRLNGAGGTTLLDATWAPGWDAVAVIWARLACRPDPAAGRPAAGRAVAAGPGLLPGPAATALVLAVLSGPGLEPPDAPAGITPAESVPALELVERSMGAVLDGPPDPTQVLCCLGLHTATGDATWLSEAAERMSRQGPAPLGAAIGVNLLTALVAAGRDPAPTARALAEAGARALSGDPAVPADVRLEYAVAAGANRWGEPIREVTRRAAALLGGGLPGRAIPDPGPELLARTVMMLGMVGDRIAADLAHSWWSPPDVVGEQAERRLLADLVDRAGDADGGRTTAQDAERAARILLPLGLVRNR